MNVDSRPAVGEVLGQYLGFTENWIHAQLRVLRAFRPLVLARQVTNLDRFPLADVCAIRDQPWHVQVWNEAMRGVRGFYPRHLRCARRLQIRLLHAHFGPRGVKALPLAAELRVPLVTSFYGSDLGRHRHGVDGLPAGYAVLFARGAAFLAEGPHAAALLVALGCPADKIRIHRLGVDVEQIEFRPRPNSADGAFRVLMAGRFTEKKGLRYGLEAWCRLAVADSATRLTIVGDAKGNGAQQAIKRELLGLVKRFGVSDRVRFTGLVSPAEFRELLYDHDVFLQPSVHAADGDCEGGLPVAAIEAAASGMPIIASRHCDLPEMVSPGATGWLCAERDVDGLLDALQAARDQPALLLRYSHGARARVEATFNLRHATLDAAYHDVISGAMSSFSSNSRRR